MASYLGIIDPWQLILILFVPIIILAIVFYICYAVEKNKGSKQANKN